MSQNRDTSTGESAIGLPPAAASKAAFEHAPIGLAVFTPDGTWLALNERVCEILGYTLDELCNLTVQDVTYPEDYAADLAQFERLLAGETDQYEIDKRYVRKNGDIIWGHLTVSAAKDERTGKTCCIVAAVEETTARELQQQQFQQLAELINLAEDAILIQEPDTNRITFWSDGAERTYGWTSEEAIGHVAYELLGTKFPVPVDKLLAKLETAGRWSGDLIHMRKDGRRIIVASRWALQHSKDSRRPTAILEVNRDVTEQRALEAESQALSDKHKLISDSLQHSLLMIPPPDVFPGITIKAFYQGAQDDLLVGGDFFDIFAVAENTIALVIGDVTGKGLEAAMYTAEVKFVLRGFLREDPAPAVALERLNNFICAKERLDPAHIGVSYVALAAVVVDTITGHLGAALAGMELPFVLRADGDLDPFASGGPLLGVDAGTSYQSQGGVLGEGDTLVMSTDGLIEARNPSQRLDFFGKEGLESAMREAIEHHASLAEVGAAVIARAQRFVGGSIRDDVCLLLARRTLPA